MKAPDRAELRQHDAQARERAQTVFDRPFMLEAGAGTGKTSSLVARILAWCVGPGWRRSQARLDASVVLTGLSASEVRGRVAGDVLSRVSAITFTEAAAAEMSARVGRGLVELAQGAPVLGLREALLDVDTAERKTRAAALLGTLDHLVVCTIHAWCRRLLARYPLECGWHPNFEIDADGRLEEGVVRERVEAALRDAYREGAAAPLFELAVEGHGPAAIEAAVAGLMAKDVDGDSLGETAFSRARVTEALASTRECLVRLHGAIGDRFDEIGGQSKVTLATRDASLAGVQLIDDFALGDLDGESGIEALETWIQAFQGVFPSNIVKRLEAWGKHDFGTTEAEHLGGHAAEVADCAGRAAAWARGVAECRPAAFERARRALAPLVADVSAEMRARGIATFDGLLVQARNLLRDRPDVRSRMRREMDQLLVDEFQDTSALQCEIVRWLALEGEPDERPGLFLVGDPKQSIYGWRQADLRAYDAFVKEVRDAGGELAILSVNYRSVPAILDDVARVIEPIMHERDGMQPRFQPLAVAPELEDAAGFGEGACAPVEYWLSWRRDVGSGGFASGLRAASVTALEAGFLAEDLQRQHDEHGVGWSDMAVLLRSTTDLDRILEALRNRRVPYAVERDRSYYRRREVIDAAGLVRAVLDSNDAVAMVTLLRSSAVGVPDAAWIPFWRRGFPEAWTQLRADRPEVLASLMAMAHEVAVEVAEFESEIAGLERVRGWEWNLVALLEALALLRESCESDPADVFVEKLRALTLFEIVESGRYLGLYRRSNLDRFFGELVREWVDEANPQKILRRLRRDVSQRREVEEAPPPGAAVDAVRIMTIHKAKGLDFEHVYVAQLGKRPRPDTPDVVEVVGRPDAPEFWFLGVGTLGMSWERSRVKAVAQRERVRTLYVAMTRAKTRLVLIGAWPERPEARAVERATNHLELLQSATERPVDLRQWMEEATATAGGVYRDGGGVRWVLPNPASGRAETVARGRGEASQPLDSERQAAISMAFGQEQKRAADRMLRRFGAPVTAERRRQAAEVLADGQAEETAGAHGLESPPDIAAAAGIAVHRALEEFSFDEDPVAELQRQRERVPEWIAPLEDPSAQQAARQRAEAVLDRFRAGPLFERFVALGPQVIARELDVWLAPDSGDEGPVAYRAGAIDLLCRDPEGAWLVIDFKTDDISEDEVSLRAQRYAFQASDYSRALQAALGLEVPPRFEFWFLTPGAVAEA